MSLRGMARNLWIDSLTALQLDARARRRARNEPGPVVRVILAHGTPRSSADAFRRQLEWANKHFELIDFARFKRLWEQPTQRSERPAVLFTFDDGLASNHDVGAPILEEFGTRGVFFVVPRFSMNANGEEARRYFVEHLKGAGDDFTPMTPEQIKALADRGHTIGNHTYSHARLSETAEADLPREIGDSARTIESWTGRPVETFAWTFYWDAITPAAYRTVLQHHPFCFSPCPGLVRVGNDHPKLIWRTNVEAWARPSLCRFMYSGLADGVWAARRQELARRLGV